MRNFFRKKWEKLPYGVRFFLIRRLLFLKIFLHDVLDIKEGTDQLGTIETIRKNVKIKGSNVWILISGAMLASIGLDTNSAAVIIGAMLISPLMNPILGIGLSVGINDKDLLIDSLKNFLIAIAASLITSYIYFKISPLGNPTPELEARIKPTLLDVFVAFFGGIAGIVANSRIEKSNAIPGVAIATALMPPVCTAGFGIATHRWEYFMGAFYLFFINAVFISLSTYIIVKYLNFPTRSFINPKLAKRVKIFVYTFVFVVITPSAVLFYNVIKETRTKQQIKTFFEEKINSEHRKIVNYEIIKKDSVSLVKAYLTGKMYPYDSLLKLQQIFHQELPELKLEIIQTELSPEIQNKLEATLREKILNAIKVNQQILTEQELKIDSLEKELKKIKKDTLPVLKLTREIKTFIPDLLKFSIVKTRVADTKKMTADTVTLALVKLPPPTQKQKKYRHLIRKYRKEKQKKLQTIYDFLGQRLKPRKLLLIEFDNYIKKK